mmetsp:Transcript_100959/g.292028  ORF Transcript_100959/g.292028 Transcript_100959/m.292028 type:complete len:581 (+) Transcript_100959:50-1792(+)
MGLLDGFREAVLAKAAAGEPGADKAAEFLTDRAEDVAKALNLFGTSGELAAGHALPASCYNDFYKWTMFPVMRVVERSKGGDVRCTFSVNIRDAGYRKKLYESAVGKADPSLFEALKERMESLTQRPFDRALFERCVSEYKLPGWDADALDAVCGPAGQPRTIGQELQVVAGWSQPAVPSKPGDVLLQVFVAPDVRLGEERVYIEATGPWHRVTWLETTLMQAAYEALFRHRMRLEYSAERGADGKWDDGSWYPRWLADAFCRCVRSVHAAGGTGLRGGLMTGRRTGGLALMLLQSLYAQAHLRDAGGNSLLLGTSSVTSRYMLLDAGVLPERVPKCMGTHAHELQMVISAIFGELDDKAGMPITQVIAHMLYFMCSLPQGDVRDAARKALMPMLPDTLGTRAFMKCASVLKVPAGAHAGEPILSVIGSARQDSGGLEGFRTIMQEFAFGGAMMASEIETPDDLVEAQRLGYKLFGAGGYMGDSEKAWDQQKASISMAGKVLRVHVGGAACKYFPVKTGETSETGKIKEGKFEADGTLCAEGLAKVMERTQMLATANAKVDAATLQSMLDDAVASILGGS